MTGRLVKDINPNGSSSPSELVEIEGILYFAASTGTALNADNTNDNSDGEEEDVEGNEQKTSNGNTAGLWKSDGSEGGTRLLRSFDGVSNLVEANGILYFIGKTDENYELWSSDGTSAGTKKVDNLYPGTNNFAAYNLFAINDTLFFSASGPEDSSNGYELWRWEGNDVGTKIFRNLFPDRYISQQTIEDGTLTIETEEFTSSSPGYSPDSFPSNFTNAGNGNFFFTAYTTTVIEPIAAGFAEEIRLGGVELWFSDGSENGTRPIQINNQEYEIYNPVDGSFNPPSYSDRTLTYIANGSSFPKNLTRFADNLYFSANDGESGFELWTINNNGLGQAKVSDLNKGVASIPDPNSLTAVGNKLYFTIANEKGRELWVLNKQNKAQKVTNSGENPRHLTEINGTLYYSAESNQGREPWLIQNNKAPRQLQDINPGIKSSNPKQFKLIQKDTKKGKTTKFLYFSASESERGIELWRKNISKTNSKAERYADIYSGPPSSDPRNLVSANENLFFTANDGKVGRELWTIDALPEPADTECNPNTPGDCNTTKTNSSIVKNISKGSQSSNPGELHNHRGTLFFSANNGRNGYEPWSSQGKSNTTQLFKDINNGKSSSFPSSFTTHKTSLFFSADDGRKGAELWSSKGKENNTRIAADIYRGKGSSSPSDLLTQGNTLYLSADDGIHGRELWSYTIKTGKYQLIRDIRSGSKNGSNPSELTLLNDQVIFAAEDNVYGRELWSSDGSKSGTTMLLDINPGGLDSNPKDLVFLDNNIYFTANTFFNGRQIHKLDGSGLIITEVKGSLGEERATEPSALHASRDILFYSAKTIIEPPEDGTKTTDPGGFMVAKDGIGLEATKFINDYNESIDQYRETKDKFWLEAAKSDANFLLSSSLPNENDSSLAEDWNQYFQSLSGLSPIQISSGVTSTAASRNTTVGSDPNSNEEDKNSQGRELWISNGKTDGNTLLKDIYPGKGSSDPKGFTTVGTKTYFSADDGQSGEELWVSDGTKSGTYLLSDINTGSKGSSPRSITDVDGSLYFSAKSERYGRELWRLENPESNKQKSRNSANISKQELQPELTRMVFSQRRQGRLRGKRNTTDEFVFSKDNQFGTKKADQITRFSSDEGDTIELNPNSFAGIKKRRFKTTNTLQKFNRELERKSNIIYFEPTGELYFDQNGRKAGFGDPKESGLFAILKGAPDLNPTDIGLV